MNNLEKEIRYAVFGDSSPTFAGMNMGERWKVVSEHW
jgi:hypothetical protein